MTANQNCLLDSSSSSCCLSLLSDFFQEYPTHAFSAPSPSTVYQAPRVDVQVTFTSTVMTKIIDDLMACFLVLIPLETFIGMYQLESHGLLQYHFFFPSRNSQPRNFFFFLIPSQLFVICLSLFLSFFFFHSRFSQDDLIYY